MMFTQVEEAIAYIESKRYAVINNSNEKQVTKVYDGEGNFIEVELKPTEIRWMDIK